MIGGVTYRPVPAGLEGWFATLHRGDFEAGRPIRLPALLGQLWFCSGPIWWVPPGGAEPARLPTVALIGPTNAAFQLMAEGPGFILGCGFWPLGWAMLTGLHAANLADTAVDASDLWPEACAAFVQAGGGGGEAAWLALERLAADLGAGARPTPDRDRIAVIDAWLATAGCVEDLCVALDRCPRQVGRITRRTHGGPPRLIASKWRSLQAASELGLASPEGAWWSERFADQSHLIREFRRFIGETPKGFAQKPNEFAHRVVADPWHVRSDHPLALFRPRPGDGRGSLF